MKKMAPALVLMALVLLCNCNQKKWFETITLKGSIIDWFNHEPLPATINVNAQKTYTTKQNMISITSFASNEDGTFERTIKAAKSSHYYIHIVRPGSNVNFGFEPNIPYGGTYDFGALDVAHDFTCRVTMTYTSNQGAAMRLGNGYTPHGSAQTDYVLKYTKKDFDKNNGMFVLPYTISYVTTKNYTVLIPITDKDTLSTEIFY
ncbi:MAG: hypothetical protein V4635_03050 [Bacteroidota bacterium]